MEKTRMVIPGLGEANIPSPVAGRSLPEIREVSLPLENAAGDGEEITRLEEAGARRFLYFNPAQTSFAIATCGGLCPGINDVIRSIVMTGHHIYKVPRIVGIRYGLRGFIPEYGHRVMTLTPENSADIHVFGGTTLGTSRGPQDPERIVQALVRMGINCLFIIGGDGTMRGAKAVYDVLQRQQRPISIIGIPKTIDNDINMVPQSFGFETAVDKATEAIQSAHTEAASVVGGIGIVRLMGRESGFIAAQATVSLKEVNFCLIPEAPIELHGENGLLAAIEQRLKNRGHAVLVVAEGAGQNLLPPQSTFDASGNRCLGDICAYLRAEIATYLEAGGTEYSFKFIDPSYSIRSGPANANDRVYCGFLGRNAVHAAMSGKTGMVVAKIMDRFVHLPLEAVIWKRRTLSLRSDLWRAVIESTGQNDVPDATGVQTGTTRQNVAPALEPVCATL